MPTAICEECEKEYEVICSDLDWNIEVYEKHSESMGSERHHDAKWEETCSKCGNRLIVDFTFVEYPEGEIESTDIETLGCEFEGDCSPTISFR